MRLTVRLFASLRERAGTSELILEGLPEDLDVAGLKAQLSVRHPELGDLSAVAGVVGTDYVHDGTALRAGDAVALLPPVSGGAPADDVLAGVFELSAEPLDVMALQSRVAHPSCGAVVLFTGVTRETNRGQDVEHLDYEAFHDMAGPEMGRIFAACRAVHGPKSDSESGPESGAGPERELRMICAHRTGRVGVGDPSVVIAVASPHRDAAFQAARYLIDTLKDRLPVWKKEVYGDGHHWIGDRS